MSPRTESQLLYDSSIALFLRTTKNILHIMDRAEEHAKDKGENIEEYAKLQLYPDMKK